jgi:hypothetical protein
MKTLKLIGIICLGVAVGFGGGFGVGVIIYQQEITDLNDQASELVDQVVSLTNDKQSLLADVANLREGESRSEQDVATRDDEIVTLNAEIAALESDLAEAERFEDEVQEYKEQATILASQLSYSQGQLLKVLDMELTQDYEWDYLHATWDWELNIPLSTYVRYSETPRPQSFSGYTHLAMDSGDDDHIDALCQQIEEAALAVRFTELEKVDFVIGFVQSLRNNDDDVAQAYDEYPKYPIETLFDQGGDSDDTAILAAALLDSLGYDVALLVLEDAKHMAVGINIVGADGDYYEHDGKQYYYLETTVEGWRIGVIPWDITELSASVYPLEP